MADTFWVAGGKWAEFATAANWTNGVPGNGDNGYFDGRSQTSVLGATVAGPDLLVTEKAYHGDIGTAGSPLDFSDTAWVILKGDGAAYMVPGSFADNYLVLSRNNINALTLFSESEATADVNVLSGHVTIYNAIAALRVMGDRGRDPTVQCDGTVTTLYQSGGEITIGGGGITTLVQMRGVLTVNLASIVTAHIGGVVEWGPRNLATITSAYVYSSGTLDFSENRVAKTITTLDVHRGGRFDNPNNITVTNFLDLNNDNLTFP